MLVLVWVDTDVVLELYRMRFERITPLVTEISVNIAFRQGQILRNIKVAVLVLI